MKSGNDRHRWQICIYFDTCLKCGLKRRRKSTMKRGGYFAGKPCYEFSFDGKNWSVEFPNCELKNG
jgi:hypothetical protein